MAKSIPLLLPILLFLISQTITNTNAQTLCLSQFALANEACASSYAEPGSLKFNIASSESEVDPADDAHRSHHHHSFHDDEAENTPCCRRLMGIDNACMCQILARLPKFIVKPKHIITLSPIKGCDVSFECDGA
ncbi:hypothetical protein LUZ60_013653 [Juncus effusus]|nr:hypothetical protein LUZ60_013653 [Juncus effusus]